MTLSPDRVTCMGATSLNTGKLTRFCNHQSLEDIVDATVASAAIPGIFLAQNIGNDTYIDGGTVVNVDITGAVLECLNLGYNESQIIVDVIECRSDVDPAMELGNLDSLTVLPVFLRAAKLYLFSHAEIDYAAAIDAYPGVNFRYRIFPSIPIPGSGIAFNQTQMQAMEVLGRQDAANAVAASPPAAAVNSI